MRTQTLIITGPSGSGKGTQAVLLKEYLKRHDPQNEALYVQVGAHLRGVAREHSHTSRSLKKVLEGGRLAPEFLTVWAWGDMLLSRFTGNEHLIFDGTPRRLREAEMFSEALQRENVERRLQWYDTEVVPVLNLFRENASYTVLDIDGARTVEEVHQSIVEGLF